MRDLGLSVDGKRIVLDDGIYDWLRWYKWSWVKGGARVRRGGYGARKISGRVDGISRFVYVHRMIAGVPQDYRVLFRNGDSLDCRVENLQIIAPLGKVVEWEMSYGASAFHGVIWDGRYGMWRAQMDGMLIGYYIYEVEAARAYNGKAAKFLPETLNDLSFL